MTFAEFAEVFAVLALQTRASDTDEPTARSFYKILKDEELPLVKMAADRIARESEWFPKASEWLKMIDKIRRERILQLEERLRAIHKSGRDLCTLCGDTGWTRDEQDRVSKCACQEIRRLEVVGLKALPA